MEKEFKEERRTLEKIIEQIGPFGLIAVCVTLIVNIASKPLDSNSWVSVIILCSIIGISFFIDRLRLKSATEIEKIRIQSNLEFRKHKSWEETTKPIMEASGEKGVARMERLKIIRAVLHMLEDDLKTGELNKKQEAYSKDLIKRLGDLERTTMLLYMQHCALSTCVLNC